MSAQFSELKEQGNALVKRGDFAAAVPVYSAALACDGITPQQAAVALANRSLAHLHSGNPNAAAEDAAAACARDPGYKKAQYRLAQAREALRQAQATAPATAKADKTARAKAARAKAARARPKSASSAAASTECSKGKRSASMQSCCDHCGRAVRKPKACGGCLGVCYCGKECAAAAWKTSHKHECARRLPPSGAPPPARCRVCLCSLAECAANAQVRDQSAVVDKLHDAVMLAGSAASHAASSHAAYGAAALRVGRVRNAILAFERAVAADPALPGVRQKLRIAARISEWVCPPGESIGFAYKDAYRAGFDRGSSAWQEGQRLVRGLPRADERASQVPRLQPAWRAALRQFQMSEECTRGNFGALREMALCHLALGDDESAERCYRRAILHCPPDSKLEGCLDPAQNGRSDLGDLHLKLGLLLCNSRQDEEAAIRSYRRAAMLEPSGDAHFNIGVILSQRGDTAGAQREFRLASAHNPKNAMAAMNVGIHLKRSGDFGGALEWYRKAVAAQPAYAMAWHNLGNTVWELDGFPGIAYKPGDGDVKWGRKLGEAVSSYERALALTRPGAAAALTAATRTPFGQDSRLFQVVSYKLAALLSSKPDWGGAEQVLARALGDPRAGNELKVILQTGMAKARDKVQFDVGPLEHAALMQCMMGGPQGF